MTKIEGEMEEHPAFSIGMVGYWSEMSQMKKQETRPVVRPTRNGSGSIDLSFRKCSPQSDLDPEESLQGVAEPNRKDEEEQEPMDVPT